MSSVFSAVPENNFDSYNIDIRMKQINLMKVLCAFLK